MKSVRVSGRVFGSHEVSLINKVIEEAKPLLRSHIAREVCKVLKWYGANGEMKAMSCRVALLRLHREGLITLPRPRNGNGNGKPLSKQKRVLEDSKPILGSVVDLHDLALVPVVTKEESALYNGMIETYHYLGYQPLPGAQIRYLIRSTEGWLGALGWGAAAWKVAARDRWIGWQNNQREAHLNKVINNARFLLLPWVRCSNLASKVLAMSERRVANDFADRYAIRPVLLETFVEQKRFFGTCYRAANWQPIGQTQGRGKRDRNHEAALPIKDVYVKPLIKHFRRLLLAP
jgi:hypothetical protein